MAIGDGKMEWASDWVFKKWGDVGEIQVKKNGQCCVGYRNKNGNFMLMGKGNSWVEAVKMAEGSK